MTSVRALKAPKSGRTLRGLRVIYLVPVLAYVALSAWAFSSPIGASPDDDYHLVSTWCANGGGVLCEPGADKSTRVVATAFRDMVCFAGLPDQSAKCQNWTAGSFETARGNFAGEYPPIYYATMNVFAGPDIQVSALMMRMVNSVIFVGLATILATVLPAARRTTLLWGWLVTLVPLGMFLIPSNNPSGWAITGVGTAYLALLGWFESSGRRRWALGALYVVGVLIAAGARGDSAVFAVGATVTVLILTATRGRHWASSAILPAVGIALAVILLLQSGQVGAGLGGLAGPSGPAPGLPVAASTTAPVFGGQQASLSGSSLIAYNVLMLPYLWSGVWGTWKLGWFDTDFPSIVPGAAALVFVVVVFAGVGRLNWRKAIAASGVLGILAILPLYVLSVSGVPVGQAFQPRYLLPLIVLFAFVLLTSPARKEVRFTRVQTVVILAGLSIANMVALEVNLRRYLTGADAPGFDLDSGAEWWWTGFPVGPNVVWIIGAIAYVGMLALLWPQLRRTVAVGQPGVSQ